MCACMCAEGRSVAPQIEIDGQDDGEEDDGSEDEDQDAILDDPASYLLSMPVRIRELLPRLASVSLSLSLALWIFSRSLCRLERIS